MTMDGWLLLAIGALILLGGGALIVLGRKGRSGELQGPSGGVAEMGYGRERYARELALWRGTLRRLEIQADFQSPVSEGVQQQIEEARRRIAEAERQLQGDSS